MMKLHIKQRDLKKIIAVILCITSLFVILPELSHDAHAVDHSGHSTRQYCDAAHPHAIYIHCFTCGVATYTGAYQYKDNCSTCNVSLICPNHGTVTYSDSGHPHATYCRGCCGVLRASNYVSTCSTCNPSVCATGHSPSGPATCMQSSYCLRCGATLAVGGHSTAGKPVYCEATHDAAAGGHPQYQFCATCGKKVYTGGVQKKSNCAVCDPAILCDHPADRRWIDPSHENNHREVCQDCCRVMREATVYSGCGSCATGSSAGNSTTQELNIIVVNNNGSTINGGVISIDYEEPQTGYMTVHVQGTTVEDPLEELTYVAQGGIPHIISNGTTINIAPNSPNTVGSYIFTARTHSGRIRTATVTVKVQSAAIGNIRYRTYGINVTAINGIGSVAPTTVRLVGASTIDPADKNLIPRLLDGRYDGATYHLYGSMVVEVYDNATGISYGTYNLLTQGETLARKWNWGASTIASFNTMKNAQFSYQAPKAVSGTANWLLGTSVGKTMTAQQAGAPQYIFPYESTAFVFNAGEIDGYDYTGLTWSKTDGSSGSADKNTTSYAYANYVTTSPGVTVNFNYEKSAGSVYVRAIDSETGSEIPHASIFLVNSKGIGVAQGGGLPYGTYTATATAQGYYSATASATISKVSPSALITLSLSPVATGSGGAGDNTLDVQVVDNLTGSAIGGASVTVGGVTKSSSTPGYCSFTNLATGSIAVTASKSGYYSRTVSKTIIAGTNSMVVRLSAVPNGNAIHVTVKNRNTSAPILGATVSVSGKTDMTGVNGKASFAGMDSGTYPISVSADGFLPNNAMTATVSNSTANVEVLLSPITDALSDGEILVRVYDGYDNSLSGAAVTLSNGQTLTTGAGGFVRFSALSLQSYTVTASKAGYTTGSAAATLSASNRNAEVTIHLDQTEPDTPGYGRLHVTVIDSYTGLPIPQASIFVQGASTQELIVAQAEAAALYNIYLPKKAAYDDAYNYYYQQVTIAQYYVGPLSDAQKNSLYELYCAAAAAEMNTALANYNAKQEQVNQLIAALPSYSGNSNLSGYRSFGSILPVTYNLSVSAPDYATAQTSAAVTANNTTYVVVGLTSNKPVLRIQVFDNYSKAVLPGATVYANGQNYRNQYTSYYNNYTTYYGLALNIRGAIDSGTSSDPYLAELYYQGYLAEANNYKALAEAALATASMLEAKRTTDTTGSIYLYGVPADTFAFTAEKKHFIAGSASISYSGGKQTLSIYLNPEDSNITVRVVDRDTGAGIPTAKVLLNSNANFQSLADSHAATARYYAALAAADETNATIYYNRAYEDIKVPLQNHIDILVEYGYLHYWAQWAYEKPGEFAAYQMAIYGSSKETAEDMARAVGLMYYNARETYAPNYLNGNANWALHLQYKASGQQNRAYEQSNELYHNMYDGYALAISIAGGGTQKSVSAQATTEYNGIPMTDYTATASAPGYVSASVGITTSAAAPRPVVTIALAKDTVTTGTVNVTVQNEAGTRLSGAAVALNSGVSGTTNASGSVSFANVPFSSVHASAYLAGYDVGTASGILGSATPVLNLTITLRVPVSQLGDLSVYVKDAKTGAAITDAIVEVKNDAGVPVTNLRALPFGRYTATAGKAGYTSGSGSATLSAAEPSGAIVIFLEKEIEFAIEPIINGVYRKGSTVMVSAAFTATADVTPEAPAKVNFTAAYRKAEGDGYTNSVISAQQKDVIVPEGEQNLVWFSFTLPDSGYYTEEISVRFRIGTGSGGSFGNNTECSTLIPVVTPTARSSPQTKFEKAAPASFLKRNLKVKNAPTASWSVWMWSNGGFVKANYTAHITATAVLSPDQTAGYRVYNNAAALWTTRSGYGLNTELTVRIPAHGDMLAGDVKADVLYPEYNYTSSALYSDNLHTDSTSLNGSTSETVLTFPIDRNSISKGKMHKTPVWYPDGEYTVNYQIYDVWTPAGELTATDYATILIDANLYDDSYAKPLGK